MIFDGGRRVVVDNRQNAVDVTGLYVEGGVGGQLSKHVLDAIEQVPFVGSFGVGARLEFFLGQRVSELLEQMALFLGELLRCQPLHRREQIAVPASAELWESFATHAERRPRLTAFRNLQRLGTIERRHLDLAAECQRREVHRNLAEQIHAVAPKELVFLDVNDNIQMPWWATLRARLALTLQAELLARGDTRRDLHRDLSFMGPSAGATALWTGLGDDTPRSLAPRARARNSEEPLLEPNLALSVALRARGGRRPWRGA